MEERKLFGTDGIRGKANVYPLIPEIVVKVGKAIARVFSDGEKRPKVIIGKDTRISGYILETSLTSGLCSMGADVILVGPMPTPAIAHLTKSMGADAGIVLTASHNPAEDNGIKLFSSEGIKLSDKKELEIEKHIFDDILTTSGVVGNLIGKAYRVDDATGRYIEFTKQSILNYSLSGMKIVMDCANGATYKIAPKVFKELGADVIVINNEPDGMNINKNCGALYPEGMGQLVKAKGADIGLAFDGDGDRIIVCDENGEVIDGDTIIYLIAKNHLKRGVLKNNTVVVTDYSNLAFDAKMKESGIETVRVQNGDRYVIEEMLRGEFVVGGEKSGHVILSRYSTTGDGIVTALHLTKILKKSERKLSELSKELVLYPQIMLNVKVSKKKEFSEIVGFNEIKEKIESTLKEKGRLFVRYSGTENLCRIMLEGEDLVQIKSFGEQVKEVIEKAIGSSK